LRGVFHPLPTVLTRVEARAVLESDADIRTIQDLLGQTDVRATMIYSHLSKRGGPASRSPADNL